LNFKSLDNNKPCLGVKTGDRFFEKISNKKSKNFQFSNLKWPKSEEKWIFRGVGYCHLLGCPLCFRELRLYATIKET